MRREDVIREFESARLPPDVALRAAARAPDEFGAAVIELVDKAAAGIQLLPKQGRILFFGIHALAAARWRPLYRPLLKMLGCHRLDIGWLLGNAVDITLADIVVSVFDGDPEPLIAVIDDAEVDPYVRAGLLEAVTKLSLDGAIAREWTRDFLDRFDRERRAPDGDFAWRSWSEAILLLGLADLADRVRTSWQDGRLAEREIDRQDWEEILRKIVAAPENAAELARFDAAPIDDPAAALAWLASSDSAATSAEPATAAEPDPAARTALDDEEIEWLAAFLTSAQVPPTTMPFVEFDGFLTGMAVRHDSVAVTDMTAEIWGSSDGAGAAFDSDEQAEYFHRLVSRHWQSMNVRLGAGYPLFPPIPDGQRGHYGRLWASGFLHAIQLRHDSWLALIGDEQFRILLGPIFHLYEPDAKIYRQPRSDDDLEMELGVTILALHRFWHDPQARETFAAPVRRGPKIGRNQPCPCGSGRKYKRCCGSEIAAPSP